MVTRGHWCSTRVLLMVIHDDSFSTYGHLLSFVISLDQTGAEIQYGLPLVTLL